MFTRRKRLLQVLIVSASILLSSCSLAPSSDPASPNSKQTQAPQAERWFVYTANRSGWGITAQVFEKAAGRFIPIPGSPFGTLPIGSNRSDLLLKNPEGQFVLSTNTNDPGGITSYSVDAAGRLMLAEFGYQGSGILPSRFIGMAPQSGVVYEADGLCTGDCAPRPFLTKHLFNPADGTLSWGNVLQPLASAGPLAFSLSGTLLFVGRNASSGVDVFRIGQGQPQNLGISPSGPQPALIVSHPKLQVFYLLSKDGITAYSYDENSGTVTAMSGSPAAAAQVPNDFAVDPEGKWLISVSFSGTLSLFTIDEQSGTLHEVSASPFATEPYQIGVESAKGLIFVSTCSPLPAHTAHVTAYSIQDASITSAGRSDDSKGDPVNAPVGTCFTKPVLISAPAQ